MTPKVCFHILSLNEIKKCLPEKFNFKSSLTMSANKQPPKDPHWYTYYLLCRPVAHTVCLVSKLEVLCL